MVAAAFPLKIISSKESTFLGIEFRGIDGPFFIEIRTLNQHLSRCNDAGIQIEDLGLSRRHDIDQAHEVDDARTYDK